MQCHARGLAPKDFYLVLQVVCIAWLHISHPECGHLKKSVSMVGFAGRLLQLVPGTHDDSTRALSPPTFPASNSSTP